MVCKRRILYVIFAAVIALLGAVLAGCGGYSDSLQRVLAEDRIVFGVEPFNMPLSFETEGQPGGMSAELAREIANRLNVEAEFVYVTPSDVQTALDEGTIDLYINLPSPGQKEAASMLTIDTGLDYRNILVATPESGVTRLFDLAGGDLCLIPGSQSASALDKAVVFKADLGSTIPCENASEQFEAINSGKADAMLIDEPLYRYIMNGVENDYVVLEDIISQTSLLLALRQQDTRLADRIESLFDDMRSDGTFKRICSDWIGAE